MSVETQWVDFLQDDGTGKTKGQSVPKFNGGTSEGEEVIRAFSNEKFEEDRFDVANKDLTKVNMFVNRMMSCMMPAMMLIMNVISILIV